MAHRRISVLGFVAASVSLVALTGCPNAGTQPPLGTTGQPQPTSTPGAAATATPPATNGTTPTTAPTSAPQGEATGKATVRGKVYDETGAVVEGATVRVRSLSSSAPFDSTVNVTGGAYVVNEVPTGVQVEITASKDNWTKRTRVESLLAGTAQNTNYVNFGGLTNDTQDPTGAAYFLSDYPEIVSARVTDQAVNRGEKLSYKLTFSEPLDETNQRLVQRGFAISATGTAAAPGEFTIRDGSTFMTDDVEATTTWNAEGTEMTIEFPAPLLANKDDDKAYRFTLSHTAGDDVIKDKAGKELGMATDATTNYLALKRSSLRLQAEDDTAAERWSRTHTDNTTFDVLKDETKPTLSSVAVSSANRVTLTFSEPMGAYMGDTVASSGLSLANFTFRVGKSSADVEGEDWSDTTAVTTINTFGAADPDADVVYAFSATAARLELSDRNPKEVRLIAQSSTDRFDVDAKAIKVRVDNDVQDPAGNGVSAVNDANFKVGTF